MGGADGLSARCCRLVAATWSESRPAVDFETPSLAHCASIRVGGSRNPARGTWDCRPYSLNFASIAIWPLAISPNLWASSVT